MPRYFDDGDWEEERQTSRARAERQSVRASESRPAPKLQFQFVSLDSKELLESKTRTREAWDTYRADIAQQVEQCYASNENTPNAEETQALDYWNRNSRVVVIAYQVGLRELLAMNSGRELFLSGEGTLVRYKEQK